MSADKFGIGDVPPAPSPGKPGHFAHHEWLASGLQKVAAGAIKDPANVVEIDITKPEALEKIVDVLVALGVATKKK